MAVPKPKVKIHDAGRQVIDTFGGINKALRIREGEWNEARNLTAEHYPLLASRAKRSLAKTYSGSVVAMLAKEKLAVLTWDGTSYTLHYGNDEVATFSGAFNKHTYNMLSFGAYIIIPGINAWYNTADGTSGMIEASFQASDTALDDYDGYKAHVLTLCPCDADGNELRILKAATAKRAAEIIADPTLEMFEDGDCLADGENRIIRKWHGPASAQNPNTWEIMPNLLLLRADGIAAAGFKEWDSVEISGVPYKNEIGVYSEDWDPNGADPGSSLTTYNSRVSKYDDDPNGTKKVQKVTADAIVLKDVFFTRRVTVAASAAGDVSVGREMPDMDFIVEAQNRLWGCRYGEVDGKQVNEIYASELGNFFNWKNYDGTSMASYAASVGTDGPWTGAISYQGRPYFFKETCVHKVYPSAYGAHQIVDTQLNGVQKGCELSLCQMDGIVYYMSRDGVCAYDGSYPRIISDAIGDVVVQNASFGAAKRKLYALVLFENGDVVSARMYVYHAKHGLWYEETYAVPYGVNYSAAFAQLGESVYFCNRGSSNVQETTKLWDLTGYDGEPESTVGWTCTSGLIGYEDVDQKYVSRFVLRVKLAQGSKMDVQIEYDSSGKWEFAGALKGTTGAVQSVVLPVRPRRCDHFCIKLHGSGEMALYSFAKQYAKGSDVT